MDQETWKLVLEYLAVKENPNSSNAEIKRLEQKLSDWAANDPDRKEQLEEALLLWEDTAQLPDDGSWEESFANIKQQLDAAPAKKLKIVRWWPAAIAAACIGALIFFVTGDKKTLIAPQNAIAWTTKTAAPGKIVDVMLPDSSEIWLNSGSSISFPQNLKHADIRTVKLSGEAFFKVKRDPTHPFVVKSQNIQTRVLGTSFNIRAWKGYNPQVTVLTGKVAVSRDSAGVQSAAVHLLPNQKVVYDIKSVRLMREDVEEAKVSIDWRTGKMNFDRTPMEEVFQTISHKYAVKIVTDQSFKSCQLTAKFDNVEISEVMKTISLTFDIHYTINKQTIYIKGGKCN
ncbi:FecR family protein [Pedobacter sp. UBA5917]|jgi:ferric-dicitrate binding protein FerR (iron transport regulator)|uniref:FecR family protein n=1 Tax=Pedobacter sp. UBA5917 TaxID=1947061 RepID=UPI0025DD5D59|nr:FecR family protein [Pedobacter sp. UBA5917]